MAPLKSIPQIHSPGSAMRTTSDNTRKSAMHFILKNKNQTNPQMCHKFDQKVKLYSSIYNSIIILSINE